MRRFFGLLAVLFFAMPAGLSLVGCGHKTAVTYCNGAGYGPTTGQVKTITLASNLTATGESLSYGQIGGTLSASAADCVGTTVSVPSYHYSTTDGTLQYADVNPGTGAVCAGNWNRNTGGGIADYTVCTPPATPPSTHVFFITAAAAGATSNAIAVYVHSTVTGVVLGASSSGCSGNDPSTDCFNTTTNGSTVTGPNYDPTTCVSQNSTRRLVARVYANGSTDPANNITSQVGHVTFALQGTTNIATIDANGFITANQPGSTLVTATVSNGSSATNSGFFSTCPPVSIALSAVNQPAGATNINVGLNTPQSFTATVTDGNIDAANGFPNGHPITGLALEFNSTLPVNFPVSGGTLTPAFPGTATITATCQPPTCNPAPFSQIGYQGNGKPITSNGITVTAAGTASTVLYMGSTASQYIATEDFATGQLGSPIKLPFTPNSMVISQDGSTIYMGSAGGLITLATGSGAFAGPFQAVQGTVLAVAPNNSTVVVADPTRQTVSLVNPNGSVASSFNGIGTHAQWSPDSSTLYVTTAAPVIMGNATTPGPLLTYSTLTGWQSTATDTQYTDVALTVPHAGAYFAGSPNTEDRSYCAASTFSTSLTPPTTTNIFSPLADTYAVTTDRLAATTDGKHILGAHAGSGVATLADIASNLLPPTGVPPNQTPSPLVCTDYAENQDGFTPFSSTFTTQTLTGVQASAITSVFPATNSGVAFVTYTGTSGLLPLYAPAATGQGTINYISLSGGTTTAPVAGVFSTDNTTIYVGTSGDNVVHTITVNGTTGSDTGVIKPNLPNANGNLATPNLIVQRPRRAQA